MKLLRPTISWAFIIALFSAPAAYAQTVETVYPATICDTANLLDDNSANSHVDKGPTSILGFGSSVPTTVFCPIPRTKPDSTGRVRIDVYLLREASLDVECFFRHTRRNGIPISFVVDGHTAGSGPTGNIRLTGNFPTTRRNGTFGVRCEFEPRNEMTFYTFRVREF